jgi:hypothetical protein
MEPFTPAASQFRKPTKYQLTNFYKDIGIEPYGCFSNLEEKFFLSQINPYAKNNVYDSGIIISENNTDTDVKNLIATVINNGYDNYGFHILNKYEGIPEAYQNISIKEIATLGKLAGYNYLSIYKINLNTRGKIYLTYSPPLDRELDFTVTQDQYNAAVSKPDLNYTLTPKVNNYTNEVENAPGKELSCGYPCLPFNKPMTFDDNGVEKQYMCGSVGFPTIKTQPRFSVYKITEKI